LKRKKTFDVKAVELSGSNLVEASAGTGKTYSIAILVLRLIIEKNIDIKQILMVTFTKASVAELESRIREFIREAYHYLQNSNYTIDGLIQQIVENGIKQTNRNIVMDRLRGATLNLDETAIFTIHSFCQKTLTEFAFETHQLFGSELLDNQLQLIEKAINEYWRKEITQLPIENLELLQSAGLSKDVLKEVAQKGLSGRKFIYEEKLDLKLYFDRAIKKNKKVEQLFESFVSDFFKSPEREPAHIEAGGKNPTSSFLPVCNNAEAFLETLINKRATKYVEKLFPILLGKALMYKEERDKKGEILKDILYFYYGRSIDLVHAHISKVKHRLSVMVFDDLIVNLHQAVTGSQEDLLKAELQKKYKAVFIDEFQDTDQLQYEIFDKLFGKSSILFYIGDPKQAIYSFRGADIDTYKRAAASTSNAFTMDRNFRSTSKLIQGMNLFFDLIENPFADTKIQYEAVKNGKPIDELQLNDKDVKPIAYMVCPNKSKIAEQTSYYILDLLLNAYQIEKRKIKPSDIAVLVRSKSEGLLIKKALDKIKIPSVTIDDIKVLQSIEAQNILYILKAIINPNRANINRALLTPLILVDKSYLLQESLEDDFDKFRNIAEEWQKTSVLGALSLFLKLYGVKARLLEKKEERILTNILQIMELLHQKELNDKLLPEELLNSLQNILQGEDVQGDEYIQRIESDEDAIKIVTIHKSKGLSYNIVFAPYLDLSPKLDHTFIEYKNPKLEACFSMYKADDEVELYKIQTEQENRRLIYVTLTRAVYKNYIFHNTNSRGGKGSIMHFVKAMENNPFFEALEILDAPLELYLPPPIKEKKKVKLFSRDIKKNWSVLSYSQLSDSHISFSAEEKENWDSSFDEFVFDKLPKGPTAGNFLHNLFEYADFTQSNFEELIKKVGKKYTRIFDETYLSEYQALITNVLNAKYTDKGFKLSEIKNQQKLPELEFYFNLSNFSTQKIQKLSHLINIEPSRITQGMMYGFVDLLFEHENKYYILDWKSNFLGNELEKYSSEQIELAMQGNNYHLQYLIYTVAVKRFLESKLSNFSYKEHFGGVLYVFLRGCRKDKATGVFYSKPKEELINKLDKLF